MAQGYETDLVFGIFRSEGEFRAAIGELERMDYYTGDVSIIMRDEAHAKRLAEETGTKAGEGAATGAIVGGIAGVLLGVTAAALPGGIVIAGPAAIGLGLTGAATGGIIGALVGLGIPETEAGRLEERLVEGDILVAVPSFDVTEVIEIMERNGAEDVDVLSVSPTEGAHNPWLSEHTRSGIEGRA